MKRGVLIATWLAACVPTPTSATAAVGDDCYVDVPVQATVLRKSSKPRVKAAAPARSSSTETPTAIRQPSEPRPKAATGGVPLSASAAGGSPAATKRVRVACGPVPSEAPPLRVGELAATASIIEPKPSLLTIGTPDPPTIAVSVHAADPLQGFHFGLPAVPPGLYGVGSAMLGVVESPPPRPRPGTPAAITPDPTHLPAMPSIEPSASKLPHVELPLPGTGGLMGAGLAVLFGCTRRQRRTSTRGHGT